MRNLPTHSLGCILLLLRLQIWQSVLLRLLIYLLPHLALLFLLLFFLPYLVLWFRLYFLHLTTFGFGLLGPQPIRLPLILACIFFFAYSDSDSMLLPLSYLRKLFIDCCCNIST